MGSDSQSHNAQCLTLKLNTFLLAGINLDEVCQYCVLDLLAPLRPQQMSIYSVGTDTLFRLRGSFGRNPNIGSLHEFSCLDDIHSGEQLRHGMPLANFPTTEKYASHEQSLSDLDPSSQVLWPLTRFQRLVGVVQVRFAGVPDASDLHDALSAIAAPMTLALDFSNSRHRRAGDKKAGESLVGNAFEPKPVPETPHLTASEAVSEDTSRSNGLASTNGLSPRQHRILQLMAKGMTNGQIARVLAFSESTVRQETMAIYRALKVPGRTEAVATGRELGLITTHTLP